MKTSLQFLILSSLSLLILVNACKPKPPCGNTKKVVKKKTKELKKNGHFNMMWFSTANSLRFYFTSSR